MAASAGARDRPRVLVSWSSGKDSAWALHVLRRQGQVDVVGLLTTVDDCSGRVATHAVRRELLDAQAQAIGLPLWPVPLPSPCSNADYEAALARALDKARAAEIAAVAFGDLFLEDIRHYRQRFLAPMGITPLFPLWGLPTADLARDMLRTGLRAQVTCVDPRHLSATFAGRAFDAAFLADLPPAVDPCGERGEFHTFAWAGPLFAYPLTVQVGEVVERERFIYADVLPCPHTFA